MVMSTGIDGSFSCEIPMLPTILDAVALERALAIRDLTDPARGASAIQLMLDDIVRALADRWACPTWLRRGSPIVEVADNYDVLRYPRDDVTRAARYTRYVDERRVLRTHTSAMIPPLLRLLGEHGVPGDILLACPGITYRRDVIDRLHTGEPHQLDLWRICRRAAVPDRGPLMDMIEAVVAAALPDRRHRVNDTEHGYTQQGLEIEVESTDGAWVEIGECGWIHPEVLAACGVDPSHTSGLAMGLGLDRLVMLRKGIEDVRLLRSADPRVSCQMNDLAPYRPVTRMPSIRRDLSIVVSAQTNDEMLGDQIRSCLGDRAGAIEQTQIVAEDPYDSLPPAVVARLGMRPDQKNVLLRIVISDLERTLTQTEANQLRNAIYAAVHRGTQDEWARDASR